MAAARPEYPKSILPQGFMEGKGPLREKARDAWQGEESQLSDHLMVGGGLVYQELAWCHPFSFWTESTPQTPMNVLL